tara:strand:+ start:1681 stop:2514 length:834 start_codon:yes stop_codon:yes gene_type:complete
MNPYNPSTINSIFGNNTVPYNAGSGQLLLNNQQNNLPRNNFNMFKNKNNLSPEQQAMNKAMGIGAIGAVGQIGVGIMAMGQANALNGEINNYKGQIRELENNRAAITNIYDNIKDTSDMMSNPYGNLGVATQAANIQMDQTDIALANTLDTLRATGTGAGGATALAQAAANSKRDVAASIENQEAANEKLRAQGEQQLQSAKIAEAQRLQQAAVAGEQWVFQQEEARTMQGLNRNQALLDNAMAQQAQFRSDGMGAFGEAFGGLTDIAGKAVAAKLG